VGEARVVSDPAVMLGKPVIAGTRITVELVLERLAAGESVEGIVASHSRLTPEGVRAAIDYAIQAVRQSTGSMVIDKDWLRQAVTEMNARLGIAHDPNANYLRSRELAAADGVDPNDNAFAREIIRMREEKLFGDDEDTPEEHDRS